MDEVQWITAGLKKHGKTGKGLAEALGVNPSAISRIKARRRRLHLVDLPKAAAYLESSVPPEVIEGLGADPNASAEPEEPPPAPPPERPEQTTTDIASTDIPRTRAQLEIFESRIVREAVEVTARKVYSTIREMLPTADVLHVLVQNALREYTDLKVQRLELAKVVAQTHIEAEDRRDDRPIERDLKGQ